MSGARVVMTLDAVGGVWRWAIDLARALREAGDSVVLAGLGPEPDVAQCAEAEAIGPLEWGAAPLDWMGAPPEALSQVGPWLTDLAARHDATHLLLAYPSQAAGLAPGPGPRVVAVSHSCLATWFAAVRGAPPPAEYAAALALTERGLRRADIVVAPSRAHAAALRRAYGLSREVRVVPNASSADPAPRPRTSVVVAAGRWWDEGKNAAALDAAAEGLAWPVRMLGPLRGPDGAARHVAHATAVGPLSHEATLAEIAAAGVFAAPSLYEPFGLAVLEAARAGAPLALADIPSFRENWDGAAAFFDPRAPEEVAATLTRLIERPEERLRLGAAARARAARFTPAAQAGAMRSLLRPPQPAPAAS